MSYDDLPAEVREVAEEILSRSQLEAFRLECDGHGTMTIARRLMLTRSAVRDRLHNAHTRLLKVGLRLDENGNWRREEAA